MATKKNISKKVNSKKILTEDTFNANGNNIVKSQGEILNESNENGDEVKEEVIEEIENTIIKEVKEEIIENNTIELEKNENIEINKEVKINSNKKNNISKIKKKLFGSHDEKFYI